MRHWFTEAYILKVAGPVRHMFSGMYKGHIISDSFLLIIRFRTSFLCWGVVHYKAPTRDRNIEGCYFKTIDAQVLFLNQALTRGAPPAGDWGTELWILFSSRSCFSSTGGSISPPPVLRPSVPLRLLSWEILSPKCRSVTSEPLAFFLFKFLQVI